MEEAAIKHAERAVQKVKRELAALEAATDVEKTLEAWEDFLNAVHRVYEKLKAGARGHPKSWTWFGKMQDERRDDELLCYVHHARNSDHHRFDEVVKKMPGGIGIGSYGPIRVYGLKMEDGKLTADWAPEAPGAQLVITEYANRLHVLPVTDSGVEYPTPTKYRSDPLPDNDVLTIARAAADYVEWMVAEAHSLRR